MVLVIGIRTHEKIGIRTHLFVIPKKPLEQVVLWDKNEISFLLLTPLSHSMVDLSKDQVRRPFFKSEIK
jgi:hypothetical protein